MPSRRFIPFSSTRTDLLETPVEPWFFVGALFWTIIFGGFYVLLTGIVSGWIAHRFAFDTAVPVSRLAIAIAIAWVANLSLWGWVVVVAMTDS